MNEKYQAKCTRDHDYLYLSVTHNGYQWSSINIRDSKREIPLIIAALEKGLKQERGK